MKIPLAIPTIMAGVNQTTLMALAMVVIASLVGAGGLGEDVNRALGRIEPGNAFLAGLGIVFLASSSIASRRRLRSVNVQRWVSRTWVVLRLVDGWVFPLCLVFRVFA